MTLVPLAALAVLSGALAASASPMPSASPLPLIVPPKTYAFRVASTDAGGFKLTGGKGTWWTSVQFPGARTPIVAVSFDGARAASDPVDFVVPRPGNPEDRRDVVFFLGSGGIEKLVCGADQCGLTIRRRDGTSESFTMKRAETREVSAVGEVEVSVER